MEFVIPGCKLQPSKRVQSRRVHLTYAALYFDELDFDKLLSAARDWSLNKHGLREYTIGLEQHTQPADPERDAHFHCYFEFGKQVDIRDRFHSTYFDLRGRNGRTLHPEIQAVGPTAGDRERVIRCAYAAPHTLAAHALDACEARHTGTTSRTSIT